MSDHPVFDEVKMLREDKLNLILQVESLRKERDALLKVYEALKPHVTYDDCGKLTKAMEAYEALKKGRDEGKN